MQSVGRDVTDRTESERALAEARDQADAANRAKSRFLAMTQPRDPHAPERHHRHERPVDGYAADAGADDLCQGGEDLGRCAAVADRGLLDFSKIEAGKIDLEHRPFALPR